MWLLSSKRRVKRLEEKFNAELDTLRCRIDMDPAILDRFLVERNTEAYQAVFHDTDPLVTVCIATYSRSRILCERTIPSVLNQTWKNIELIVVGDCCPDDTAERISHITDPRLRFINLEERGNYPPDPQLRWLVAGTKPENTALSLARGAFITHLDDDDTYPPERLEKLVRLAQQERADVVWHPFHREKSNGKWVIHPAETFSAGCVTTSSVMFHHWLKCIPSDIDAYRLKEPGDWNRFRKFKYLGVKIVRHPEPLLFHYKEGATRTMT